MGRGMYLVYAILYIFLIGVVYHPSWFPQHPYIDLFVQWLALPALTARALWAWVRPRLIGKLSYSKNRVF